MGSLQAARVLLFVFFGMVAAGCGGSINTVPIDDGIAGPASVAVNGAGTVQTFTITEPNYTGSFTESDTCAGVATVSPASAAGPSATFTATELAAGSCTVTISDASHEHVSVAISTTVTNYAVNSIGEKH